SFCTACSPSSAFKTVDNDTINPNHLQGHWLIVNYWADWCENCQAETPVLNQFYQQYHNQRITLVAVNFDHLPLEKLKQAITIDHITYPVLQHDPAEVWQLGAIAVLPTTFVINPHGQLVTKLIGVQSINTLTKALTKAGWQPSF
ncbi:MAG: TlpA family protein disulfide reductase, partial [Gammaproteobacteria bacterium]